MVECRPDANSILQLASNIKCLNPVTFWFLLLINSLIFLSLIGVLALNTRRNKKRHESLEALFWYLIGVVGFCLMMVIITHFWTSSILTPFALAVPIGALLFIGQYIVQKKGVCESTEKPKP